MIRVLDMESDFHFGGKYIYKKIYRTMQAAREGMKNRHNVLIFEKVRGNCRSDIHRRVYCEFRNPFIKEMVNEFNHNRILGNARYLYTNKNNGVYGYDNSTLHGSRTISDSQKNSMYPVNENGELTNYLLMSRNVVEFEKMHEKTPIDFLPSFHNFNIVLNRNNIKRIGYMKKRYMNR
jgi:hypothetical protein